jgi:hypothetical protein
MLTYNPETFANLYATDLGQSLWRFLNEDSTVAIMKTAIRLGRPPVEGIEDPLLERFEDDEDLIADRTKQMIGHMVKQIMTAHGYAIDQQNVKVSKGFFSRATRYKRPEAFIYYAHRASSNARKIALTADRTGRLLPVDDKWSFWKSFESGLSARFAFGLEDEAGAQDSIRAKGYYVYELKRLLRPA